MLQITKIQNKSNRLHKLKITGEGMKNSGWGTSSSSSLSLYAGGDLKNHQKHNKQWIPFLDLFSVFLLPLDFLLFPSSSGVQRHHCLLPSGWLKTGEEAVVAGVVSAHATMGLGGNGLRGWPLLLDERAVQWFIRRPSMATVSGKGRELSGGRSVGRLSCGGANLRAEKGKICGRGWGDKGGWFGWRLQWERMGGDDWEREEGQLSAKWGALVCLCWREGRYREGDRGLCLLEMGKNGPAVGLSGGDERSGRSFIFFWQRGSERRPWEKMILGFLLAPDGFSPLT